MLTDATRRVISDVLLHQPFCCEALYMYVVTGDVLTPQDARGEELLLRFRTHLDALAKEQPQTPVWYGDLARSLGGTIESGRCYGWMRVDDFVLVVEKLVTHANLKPNLRPPIDSYFMSAVRLVLASILRVRVTSDRLEGKYPTTAHGVFAELSSLEQFEKVWREKYGAQKWLAITGGTVIAAGDSREMIEKEIQETGIATIATPVLYVPPQGESQVLDLYSIE